MRLFLIPLLITAALVSTVVLTASGTAEAETISIDAGENWFCSADFQTQPCVTNITVGDTITWTMATGVHTVTECETGHVSCGNGFDSGILLQGETFSQTFSTPGGVSYYCSIHPDMTGEINVQEATPTPAPTPTLAPGATPAPTVVQSPGTAASPGAVPQTGGPPTKQGGGPATLLALVIGSLLVTAGGASLLAVRRA